MSNRRKPFCAWRLSSGLPGLPTRHRGSSIIKYEHFPLHLVLQLQILSGHLQSSLAMATLDPGLMPPSPVRPRHRKTGWVVCPRYQAR